MKLRLEKPTLVANELKADRIRELQTYHDKLSSKRRMWIQRHIVNLIFSNNKYLFALISSALTGVSVNILTGFLDFEQTMENNERIKYVFLLIFSVVFTVAIIVFTSKISQIQESGTSYLIRDTHQVLDYKQIVLCEHNIMFSECLYNIKLLKSLYIIIIISGFITILFLFYGKEIINIVERGVLCIICLFQK